MEELKVYLVDIEDGEEGVGKISLVQHPAFERNFRHYNDNSVKYSIINEEERIVFGPVILADRDTLRNDPPLGWHYTRYTPEIIKKIAYKYAKEKLFDSVNVHHKKDVDGVYMVESFIKSASRAMPVEYQDVADGSWFAAFKVENDEVWEHVKDGTFKGFSIEIYHSYIYSGDTKKTVIPNTNKKTFLNMEKTKVSTLDRLRRRSSFRSCYYAAFGKAAIKSAYDSVWTDKGELAVDGAFDINKEVMLFTSGNEPEVAPDGIYTIQDGDLAGETITVANGLISELSGEGAQPEATEEPETMEETTEATEAPTGSEPEAEVKEETAAIEELAEAIIEHIDSLEAKVDGISNESMMSKIDSLYSAIGDIKAHLKMPVVEPGKEKNEYSAEIKDKDTFAFFHGWKQ